MSFKEKTLSSNLNLKKKGLETLSLKKKAQIDQQTFFDFYGLTLLPEWYLNNNPNARMYRDMIINEVKDKYIASFLKYNFKLDDLTPGPLVETFENNRGEKYSIINVEQVLAKLIKTTNPNKMVQLIDLINKEERTRKGKSL